MSHEAAVRHAPIAQAIPSLAHPLRTDPRPRLAWADHMQHLVHLQRHQPALDAAQWPLGTRVSS